ncbi:MAG: hypothetical protein K0Q79_2599 [Flavipsychrobacter sp.]|jgi:hypothetical protein|nr:hypothetical protein [Flavipsychrobacter sp.]
MIAHGSFRRHPLKIINRKRAYAEIIPFTPQFLPSGTNAYI